MAHSHWTQGVFFPMQTGRVKGSRGVTKALWTSLRVVTPVSIFSSTVLCAWVKAWGEEFQLHLWIIYLKFSTVAAWEQRNSHPAHQSKALQVCIVSLAILQQTGRSLPVHGFSPSSCASSLHPFTWFKHYPQFSHLVLPHWFLRSEYFLSVVLSRKRW